MNNLPVACRLTDAELQERRTRVLNQAAKAVLEVKDREDGYAYRFAPDDETLERLFHIVNLERKCCPFLTLRVTVEPGDGPVWLEMSGPEGTKDFLAELFGGI